MNKYLLGITLLFVAGCSDSNFTLDLSNWQSGQNPTVTPTVQFPNWTYVQPGIDFRQVLVGEGSTSELFDVVRIDQTQASLAIAVDETNPKTISSWAADLGSSVVINGSYFDEHYQILTRTVTPSETVGKLLSGTTGVIQQSADQTWTIDAWSGEPITSQQAMQSYPMLIDNGELFNGGSPDTAQRTVVAQGTAGMLYFISAEYGVLSLDQLAQVLVNDLDLDIQTALNLDGGTSTGLALQSATVTYLDDSLIVPSVLYILP